HNVVAARRFAGGSVAVGGRRDRIGSEPRDGIFVVTAIHAIHAVTFERFLRVRRPLEMTSRSVLLAEQPLWRARNGEESRGRSALDPGGVYRADSIHEHAKAVQAA